MNSNYNRYNIEAQTAPDIIRAKSRFRVKVKKQHLIAHVLKDIYKFKCNLRVALSRPCIYEVLSRPVGGLAPREELCVSCLRCTIEYPELIQIHPNSRPDWLGDSYIRAENVDTILYEARTGRVPVRGAGYRGLFGGSGWDGMWTDMSEIVRPTRDGIHGREFISTSVDIGEKLPYLHFDEHRQMIETPPQVISIQVPFIFDIPPSNSQQEKLTKIFAETARQIETLAIVPIPMIIQFSLHGSHIVPLIRNNEWTYLDQLSWSPQMVVFEGWNRDIFEKLRCKLPNTIVCVCIPMDTDIMELVHKGVRVFHIKANYHGYAGNQFAIDLIHKIHRGLVNAGLREEITLIGSGGIIMAEHIPKAIICGLDAVILDTALWVALQARFEGECINYQTASVSFPRLKIPWGVQRLKNLAASWRDQLLEILGAMGLREVRRLRGEVGRCMFLKELELEAFGEIKGYEI